MPRLPPSLFWRARRIDPGAALLLPVCRDLPSALAELRWIREFVAAQQTQNGHAGQQRSGVGAGNARTRVLSLCRRRGRGEPLQYVLGTQPFGSLDLMCRRGVLIPRPEPEAYSMHLADVLLRDRAPSPRTLTVLDACTGTGCIALLLYARLRKAVPRVQVVGVDVAREAVQLAGDNAVRNGLRDTKEDEEDCKKDTHQDKESSVSFVQGDLFADDWLDQPAVQRLMAAGPLDVLVSNPPYVSTHGFARDTARSVRIFEPKLAQVPRPDTSHGPNSEDVFYHRLLSLGARLGARILLCEVGGLAQAERVVAAFLEEDREGISNDAQVEIWADNPDIGEDDDLSITVRGRTVPIRGSGLARAVFIRRGASFN